MVRVLLFWLPQSIKFTPVLTSFHIVDAVAGLIKSAEGPTDDESLAHVVDLVKMRCGKEAATRLQSDLDDSL